MPVYQTSPNDRTILERDGKCEKEKESERVSEHSSMHVCAPKPGGDGTKFSSPTITIKRCSKLKRKIKSNISMLSGQRKYIIKESARRNETCCLSGEQNGRGRRCGRAAGARGWGGWGCSHPGPRSAQLPCPDVTGRNRHVLTETPMCSIFDSYTIIK